MMNVSKYKKQYYLPPEICMDWAKKDYIAANEMYEMGREGICGQSSDLVQRRPS